MGGPSGTERVFLTISLVFRNQKMANIIDFRFKVKNEKDDKIFKIKIAWQTSVKDAIPTIKKEMATQNCRFLMTLSFMWMIQEGRQKHWNKMI